MLSLIPQEVTSPEFSVTVVGVVVGGLLGLGLNNSKGNLRAILTILGVALGGAPVAYLKDTYPGEAQWMYPIGLLTGLLFAIGVRARRTLVKEERNKRAQLFAWLDLLVVTVVTVSALVYAFI